jgi:hypothetical protein
MAITDLGGLQGCEASRLPRCLEIPLTDDGKVVSVTRRQRFTVRNIIFLLLVLIYVRGCVNPRGNVWLEGLDKLKTQITSSGPQPATFRPVAQRHNHLHSRVPRGDKGKRKNRRNGRV